MIRKYYLLTSSNIFIAGSFCAVTDYGKYFCLGLAALYLVRAIFSIEEEKL